MTKLNDKYTLKNGVEIPKIGFGTWQIAPQDAQQAVNNALELGYRHIDTALVYHNEKEVGLGFKQSKLKREDVFITSKLPAETKSYKQALVDFQTTLDNLQVDYVDLYLIHAPWPWSQKGANYDRQNQEVWRAMEEIYTSGKAKAIGVSNFNVHDLQNVLAVAKIPPMVNQIRYFIGHTQQEVTTFAQEHDILIEAYSPLATGSLLTNTQLQELAAKYQVSLAQLAIQFCIQNNVLPLPKAVQRAHAQANAQLNFKISSADMQWLNDFIASED
ncbi:aldo/keto reductase [Bombilactobacillus bombi]|uniref:aldo/keto reductase n=1 Tax=Bombilactobacillus bombi TaxID=1303590 RepID=UPI0015E5A5ED|nr:aldo/keto reductase [Bombilactobacillus bombi]MBA1434163.1 aldo/keto reductase [Bombilactobacillus bombi]